MAIPVADRAVLDTNILLAATDEARAEHSGAVAAINAWPAAGLVLYTSGQILREYLAVATRPVPQNGLGMQSAAAIDNVIAFRTRLTVLPEDVRVADRLVDLLRAVDCSGKQVHDANVVATMLVYGVDTIATVNVADFARFGDLVQVVELSLAP